MPNELAPVNELTPVKNTLTLAPAERLLPIPSLLAAADNALGSCSALDPIALLLADKRSPATRRAYASDLAGFFGTEGFASGGVPDPAEVAAFLSLSVPEVARRLSSYKAGMLSAGLAEATVNRRLAAVRSLLQFSYRLGLSATDGRGLVDGEKVQTYRDTRGVDAKTLKKLCALPLSVHGETLLGLRDAALLRLLSENALRRAEVCAASVGDFSAGESRLLSVGKGKGTQKQPVTLSPKASGAIAAYLLAGGHGAYKAGPLFRSLDRRPGIGGGRLTAGGLYLIVQAYGRRLGLTLAPHKLRHSAITAALEAGADVREVQGLSRHAKLETLMRYDDSRPDRQGKVSRLLSGLI